jgi:integrase
MSKAKRGSNNEGSIWQRQDGRWTGAAYVLTTAGTFKRTYVYGQSREEVHTRLVQLQDRSARGVPRPVSGWKVGEYLDYWLAQVAKPLVRPTTYAKYEVMVRLYLKPGLGRNRLDRLSVAAVQSYLNDRLTAGDSPAKVQAIRMVLGAALTRAMREELIHRNVARLATLPPAPPARIEPWSAGEARAFLAASQHHALHSAFVLLVLYGLRRGEVLGLSWTDVDFGQGVIHVRQQLIRAGHQLQLGPVKTAAGRRKLPLLGVARAALLTEQAVARSKAPRSSGNSWTRHDLVFTTRTGNAIEPRNLARSFDRLTRQAGLRTIRLHDLRHTTATLLKQLGVPPRDAMEILGHSRIAVTLEIYTAADDTSKREAITKLNGLLGPGAA